MVINAPESSKASYGSKINVFPLMKVGIQYTWEQFPVLHLVTIYKNSFNRTFQMQIISVAAFWIED